MNTKMVGGVPCFEKKKQVSVPCEGGGAGLSADRVRCVSKSLNTVISMPAVKGNTQGAASGAGGLALSQIQSVGTPTGSCVDRGKLGCWIWL